VGERPAHLAVEESPLHSLTRDGWPGVLQVFASRFEIWVPRSCVSCKGGYDAADTMRLVMPSGLHRTYDAHHLHFLTCSCYRRLSVLRGGGFASFVFSDLVRVLKGRGFSRGMS
jgi:hypothetical protein